LVKGRSAVSHGCLKPGTLAALIALTLLTGCISQPVFVVEDSTRQVDLTSEQIEQVQSAINTALEGLPSGDVHNWTASLNYRGTVTPIRTFRLDGSERYCREFESVIFDTLTQARVAQGRYIACRLGRLNWPVCGQPGAQCE